MAQSAPDFARVLRTQLVMTQCPLVGCTRQNRWAGYSYRQSKGSALLYLLGQRYRIETPAGPFEFVVYGTDLLMFRGGPSRPWWIEDAKVLCACVMQYTSLQPTGVWIVQELDDKLSQHYVPAPPPDEARRLVSEALARWSTEGRIQKNSRRGRATCRFCTVKRACDAMDMQNGNRSDWPLGYTIG